MRLGRARIRRRRDGTFDFRIADQERELVKSLLPQIQELLDGVTKTPTVAQPPDIGTNDTPETLLDYLLSP